MKVNIKRAIQSIKGDVDFFQPLYEAIVNSFQAEAENIEISFDVSANEIIKGYSVKDDGSGSFYIYFHN
jgi:hypothetical protein